ncbi:rod shape-determining protein MreC [Nocardioides sambongensis]|uniref:rod shape-determining protein MreC n=1 Tax=Nocardioides sambongensis TaxID=2589074 RepID=UPI001E64259C|nr:rod shape-determining protein MreC [Nocardioides sambongensis]
MTLDTMPPRRPDRLSEGAVSGLRGAGDPVRRSASSRERQRRSGPSRSLVAAVVLGCVTLMVVDKAGGDSSPVEPVRRVVGEVVGPMQAAVNTVVGPVVGLPGALQGNQQLRERVQGLEDENAALTQQLAKAGYDDDRIAQLDGLRAMAGDTGYALLPARVIGIGPAAAFSDTVTIDAGSDSGLHPDMTVVAAEGLVGRITAVTGHTATVRLITDRGSTVGGRIGDNGELGFVRGTGGLQDDGTLDLDLVDEAVQPEAGQMVLTWGSEGGAPYVAGVPIGTITRVFESVRETSYRAVVDPAVDFTALDLVGVVVPSGTQPRVIEADGSARIGGER